MSISIALVRTKSSALLERFTPEGDDELRRRSRVIVASVAIMDLVVVLTAPLDAAKGNWLAVAGEIGGILGSLVSLFLLARGRVRAAGHMIVGTVVGVLVVVSIDKGGLLASEVAWQCAAIALAVLVVGPRAALVWMLVSWAALVGHALAFDVPEFVRGTKLALAEPAGYAFEMAVLYATVWGLAYAFDRARADFLARLTARKNELQRMVDERARLYEQLQELDRMKTQFFANISHELRTPLMLIEGPVDRLLGDPSLAAENVEDLELVQRNARLLRKHVDDLLDVSKLEARKMEVRYEDIDVAELVRVTAANFDALAEERHVAYRVHAAGSEVARIDGEKIRRIVLNLVANAFTFARGEVRVSLAVDAGRLRLEVADDGPGVPLDQRSAIFERFRQAEGGMTRPHGGTGLGLAIAEELIALHGGSIDVGDAPEGGALFVATWPRKAAAAPPVATPHRRDDVFVPQLLAKPRPSAHATTSDPNAPSVLVVEDNLDMLHFLTTTLGAEYRTFSAVDGRDGLAKALSLAPDLIITDIMMPELSGDELVRAVRKASNATPIIVLTARADNELRVRLLRQGAQDYLAKPFLADELLARSRNLIENKRARDLLQAELSSTLDSLEHLAMEVTAKKRDLQATLQVARVARDEAQQASRAKTSFLSLVSHELTTPLQTMRLNIELLQQMTASLSRAQLDRIGRLERASKRLLELIETLLQYVRLDQGKLEIQCETISLGALASEIVEDFALEASQKALEVRLAITSDLAPARTDPKLVRVILSNLISNAIKYTDHGRIEVSIDGDERMHRIRVVDTGRGIPAAQCETIFEPFTQLEGIREKHSRGVGLGLSLVRELTRSLGGSVEVSSRLGAGSTFTVALPKE